MNHTILATGGCGYIGSHVAVELLAAGYGVVILDNFENSDPAVFDRIRRIAGRHARLALVEGDVRCQLTVERLIDHYQVSGAIHLAGKKAVAESVSDPLLYYEDNVGGALSLLRAMLEKGVDALVFSSSATVYGDPRRLPTDEDQPVSPLSPYGRTKLAIEQILEDLTSAEREFAAISLRYFNPVGAHRSALIGEDPNGIPNNLFPYVARVAAGLSDKVQVFGGDYPTPDGTGLRDFIHVVDLARGHVRAVSRLCRRSLGKGIHQRINLGTGRGHTVLEVLQAWARTVGYPIPFEIVGRRPGDIAASVADPRLAELVLDWTAEHGLAEMCRDHWAYQCRSVARMPREPERTASSSMVA